ncbi:ubiquitin carboxyl-terminal hydrolase 50-like [Oncorhynchus masou masou]|uniref:ubiquitin carboxyl-terminal hydrolase 50-like n=1 Tax=Oncorhynchus masou masou TaxID=90313 RepID=UPI0031845889
MRALVSSPCTPSSTTNHSRGAQELLLLLLNALHDDLKNSTRLLPHDSFHTTPSTRLTTQSTRLLPHDSFHTTPSTRLRPHDSFHTTQSTRLLPHDSVHTTPSTRLRPHDSFHTTQSTRLRPHDSFHTTPSTRKGERHQTRSSQRLCLGRKSLSSAPADSTAVTRLFEGQLSYQMLCLRCDGHSHSNQVFTILSLPIPLDSYKCSLQDCLSLFFQQSTLTCGDQKLCPECGVKRDTAVLTSMAKPPEILVLHLKRFGCHGSEKRKLRTNVLFSLDSLDLNPFLSRPSANHTSYSLYAVVNHTGDLDMGHYTALCHSTLSSSWHHFDDTAVSEVVDFLVQSPNAYILLYSRQPFHRPSIPRI